MRLVSESGALVDVSKRGYPLAGINGSHYAPVTPWGTGILKLVGLNGEPNYTTFKAIYRSNPWVYASARAIIRGVIRNTLAVYLLDSDGNGQRVRSDTPGSLGAPSAGQRLDSLLRQPEPGVGTKTWIRKLMLDWLIQGNAAAVIDRDGSPGPYPSALWHVPWSKVLPLEGDTMPIIGYRVTGASGQRTYDAFDVIHLGRGTDLDSPIGLSPLAPLRHTLALHDAVWRHLIRYFENSARPSGIIKLAPNASEAAIKLVRQTVSQLYSGPENAGKPLVTSGEWQSIMDSPQSAQIVELAHLSREEVAAAYAVPPPILGILDQAIKSNISELRPWFIREVAGPWADEFAEDLMVQLLARVPSFSYLYVGFDSTKAIRPDMEALADVIEKTRSAMTVDEQRNRFLDLPPLGKKGSDTTWMPSGQIGLGMPAPAPAPAPDPAAGV